jgi:hypothetical protein
VAGYSGAYATVLTGDPTFVGGIVGAGIWYNVVDSVNNGNGQRLTLVGALRSWTDRLSGMRAGEVDAIDHLFGLDDE